MPDPDPNEEVLESLTDEQRKAAEEVFSKKFESKLEEGNDALKGLNSLTSDADIARALQLKGKGDEVKVLSMKEYEELAKGGKPGTPPPEAKDLEDMDRKEFTEHLMTQMSSVMGKAFEENTRGMKTQLDAISQDREAVAAAEISDEIQKAEKKYKDFNDYRQSMYNIHQQNKNLSVEELYHIARTRAGVTTPAEIASERPTHNASRPTKKRKEPVAKGRRGFSDLVSKAVENLDFSSLG